MDVIAGRWRSYHKYFISHYLVALLVLCARAVYCARVCSDSDFGPFIEGAAVNKQGKAFAVNGRNQRSVISHASGSCEAFATVNDKENSELNSIRVLPDGRMLSTDTKNARVVLVSADGKTAHTYCDGGGMVQPNDVAITSKGVLYISGQRWTDSTVVGDGGIWMCKGPGQAVQLTLLGRTNGIEVSPDEKYLYVSEAFNKAGTPASNKIWRYSLKADDTLGAKSLFYDFAVNGASSVDVDGMRTDTAGNLYVTRHQTSPGSTIAAGGAQQVAVLSNAGKLVKKIPLPFSSPTNLEFGGKEGKTLFVVGRCGIDTAYGTGVGCVEKIDNASSAPGRAWSMLQKGLPQLPALPGNTSAKGTGAATQQP